MSFLFFLVVVVEKSFLSLSLSSFPFSSLKTSTLFFFFKPLSSVVEDLRRKREPLPHLAAVYFISPGGESAARVAADFGGCVVEEEEEKSSETPNASGCGGRESDDGSGVEKKKKRFGGLFGGKRRDKATTPPASPEQQQQTKPQQPPLYASAHVFFSSPPTKKDLDLLRSCPGLVRTNRLKGCADAGFEWLAVDGRCFVTQHPPAALAPLFGPAGADGEAPGARAAVAVAGRRLATLFVSAGEHPIVRFRAPPAPAPGRSLGSRALLPQRLALEVHAALSAAAVAGAIPTTPGGGGGGSSLKTQSSTTNQNQQRLLLPPPELVIIDRGSDAFSALCQAWGYEAMAADVLGLGAVSISPGASSSEAAGGAAAANSATTTATARTSTTGEAADPPSSAPASSSSSANLPWSSSNYRGVGPAVFEYEAEAGGGQATTRATTTKKSAKLDPETDPIFAALRDRHFAFASADVAARLDAFKAAHPGVAAAADGSKDSSSANGGGGNSSSSLDTRAMRSLAARLPQYRDELSRLAAHVELASRLARAVDARGLLAAGALEQAFGTGKGGSRELIAALSSSSNSSSNSSPLPPPFPQDVKLRLLLCYAATHPGKLDAAKEAQWAKLARLQPPTELARCLAGLEALGVPVYKRGNSSSSSNQGIPPLLLPGASAAMSAAACKALSRGATVGGGGGGSTFGSRVFGCSAAPGTPLRSSPSSAAALAADFSSSSASASSSSASANSDNDYLTGAVPTLVGGIFDALAAGVLDRDTFPFVVPPPEDDGSGTGGSGGAQAPATQASSSLFGGGGSLAATGRSRSVRSTHSTAAAWASRAPGGGNGSFNAGGLALGGGGGGANGNGNAAASATPTGRRVVVFVVGGVTRGEARAASAAAARTGLRCVVGGTGLLSGPWFVQALKELGSLDYSHEVD